MVKHLAEVNGRPSAALNISESVIRQRPLLAHSRLSQRAGISPEQPMTNFGLAARKRTLLLFEEGEKCDLNRWRSL